MIARRDSRFTQFVCAVAPAQLVAVEAARVEYDTTTFVVIYFCFRFRRMS
jgi:hypothetical protein